MRRPLLPVLTFATLIVLALPAAGEVVRSGSGNVILASPATAPGISVTEYDFKVRCLQTVRQYENQVRETAKKTLGLDPAVSFQGVDALIVDVDPGRILKLNATGPFFAYLPFGPMNIQFFDVHCNHMTDSGQNLVRRLEWEGKVPTDDPSTPYVEPSAEWASITFNYGANRTVGWKVCSNSC